MVKLRAHNCNVKEISTNEAKEFLAKYHKQGFIPSEVLLGLFYKDELVQVETFGYPRIEQQSKCIAHDWELYRECSKDNYQVYGGKSKLLKYFSDKYKPLALLSYCDTNSGFDGHSYAACGFKLNRTSIDYHYEYNGDIIKRYQMQKNSNLRRKGLVEPIEKTLVYKYNKQYDPNLSEKQNAENAGFKLVYGSGQQVWSKYYSDNIGFIYEITNTINGKTYIGKHNLMKDGLLKDTKYFGSGTILKQAIDKYGKKNFKIKPLYWTDDLLDLCSKEHDFIMAAKHDGKAEYNVDLADGNATSGIWMFNEEKLNKWKSHHHNTGGWKHTDETKAKISQRTKEAMTPDVLHKISEAKKGKQTWMKGKHHTEESKELIRLNHIGKSLSDETKLKLSLANKGRKLRSLSNDEKMNISEKTKSAMEQVKLESEDVIHKMGYFTVEDLMKLHNIGMRTVMRKYKKIGKYKMMTYYEDSLK